eukprot:gnl/Hemi2/20455_TR6788_c0_g1_i1.p1 gnl/Hemi2/20455_TR6788_c0_g1~~gnl/Hemi2/20455_TR6788_c0_g1_i1.p1  ORF type:complete len:194 (-),score=62.70 gnl/Hemi2/20455_TR6788_c0_g1_i1:78-659(-)
MASFSLKGVQQKQYGLIKRPGAAPVAAGPIKKPSVLAAFAETEDESATARGGVLAKGVNASLVRANESRQKQIKEEHAAALSQDATVFEYDSIFDEMHDKTTAPVQKALQQANTDRKSRYIGQLVKATTERKKEQDIWFERKLQKEVEKEKEEFGETEKFITPGWPPGSFRRCFGGASTVSSTPASGKAYKAG